MEVEEIGVVVKVDCGGVGMVMGGKGIGVVLTLDDLIAVFGGTVVVLVVVEIENVDGIVLGVVDVVVELINVVLVVNGVFGVVLTEVENVEIELVVNDDNEAKVVVLLVDDEFG